MELQEARSRAIEMAHAAVRQDEVARAAVRQAAALRKIALGYGDLFPDELADEIEGILGSPAVGDYDDRPRGAEAVRLILQDQPNHWMTVSEMMPQLRDRGWLPESENPANAVRAALERLVAASDSDVMKRRFGDGVNYSYRPDGDEQPSRTVNVFEDFGEEPF